MIRGSKGANKTRAIKIADHSGIQEVKPAFTAGHITKGHMRKESFGLMDKISMQGKRTPRISEGLA